MFASDRQIRNRLFKSNQRLSTLKLGFSLLESFLVLLVDIIFRSVLGSWQN